MFHSDQPDDKSNSSEDHSYYKLPPVTSFSDVDKNFETLSGFVMTMATAMEKHAETTNNNLTRLAEETSDNLNKLATDLKSIFSSQVMMMTICVIVIFFVVIMFKGAFDIVDFLSGLASRQS